MGIVADQEGMGNGAEKAGTPFDIVESEETVSDIVAASGIVEQENVTSGVVERERGVVDEQVMIPCVGDSLLQEGKAPGNAAEDDLGG